MPVNFNTTREEADTIRTIAHRAAEMASKAGLSVQVMEFMMDLSATHNSHPLDLIGLAEADDANFSHDVFGIRRHLDRENGKLGNCFIPRFAK